MTNEKINIKGNWMIKTLLGLTAMIFGLFLSLSVDTNRVEAAGHQEILGFTGYYECTSTSRIYVTTGGGNYEECENREDKNHGRVEFTFENKEEIDWVLNTADTDSTNNYGTFSGDTVYYLNDKDDINIYLRNRAALGRDRHIRIYKEIQPNVYTWVKLFKNDTVQEETINLIDEYLGDGIYYILYYSFTGGSSYRKMYKIIVDHTNPIAGTMTMKLGGSSGNTYSNNSLTNQSVYISLNRESDGLSGIKSNTYSVSGAANLTNMIVPAILSGSGTYNITVTTTDKSGNISTRDYTVRIDKEEPTVSFSPSSDNTYSKDKTVVITGIDSNGLNHSYLKYKWSTSSTFSSTSMTSSALTRTNDKKGYLSVTSSPSELNGVYYLHVQIKDKAGNTKDEVTGPFYFDNTAPTVSFSKNGDSTYKQTHSVTVTASDNLSLDHNYLMYAWSTSPYFPSALVPSSLSSSSDKTITTPLSVSGKYYLYIEVKDTLGNITRARTTNTFYLDNEVPTLSMIGLHNELAETNYTQGTWTNDNAVVEFYCSDSISGMKKCDLYNASTLLKSFTSGGFHFIRSNINSSSIRIRMEDNAGNVSYSSYITIRINKTNPTIVVTPDSLGSVGDPSGTSQITINATDYGGGMGKIEYKWCSNTTSCSASYTTALNVNSTVIWSPNVSDGNVRYLWVQSTDKAGNVSTEKIGPYYFAHNAGPEIWFEEPSPYIKNPKGFALNVTINSTNGNMIRNIADQGEDSPPGTVHTRITITKPDFTVIEIKQGGCADFLAMTDNIGVCDFGYDNAPTSVWVSSLHPSRGTNELSLTDNGRYTVNIGAAQADQNYNFTYSSTSFTFFFDNTKPQTPDNPLRVENNWVDGTGSRLIYYYCTSDNDGGSGLKSCSLYNGDTLIHEGVINSESYNEYFAMFTTYYSNLKVRAIDMAGNFSESPLGVEVYIDTVKPTANLSVSRNTWTNQDVTIDSSCGDSRSGIASCNVSINGNLTTATSISAEGVYDVQTIAVDNVGNINSSDMRTVRIDKTVKAIQFDHVVTDKLRFSVTGLDPIQRSPITNISIKINNKNYTGFTYPNASGDIKDYVSLNYYGVYEIEVTTTDEAGNTGTFAHTIKYENPGFSLDEITVGYGSGSATHTTGLQRGDGNTYFAAIRNDGSNPSKITYASTSSLYNQFFGAGAFSTSVKYKINNDETLRSLTNSQISIPAIVSGSGSCIAADYETCARVDTITLVVEASGIRVMQMILIISLDIRPTNTSAGSGTQSVNVNVGQEYNVEPVTFNSQIGNEIVSVEDTIEFNGEVVDSIDTNKIGTYTITTIATDSEGFKSLPVVRTLVVKDTIPPTISLFGDQIITIKKGQTYVDQGSLAIDNVDGELTVYGSGEVNYNKTGIYEITYQYIDSNGNVSEVITRTVIVKPDYAKYAILALSSITVLGIAFILIKKFNVKTSY